MKSWLKLGTKGAGYTALLAGVLTLIAKQAGIPVSEDVILQVLGLFGLGAGGVAAAAFIPANGAPEIQGMEKNAYDAWFILDHEFADDEAARKSLDELDARMKLRYRANRLKPNASVPASHVESRFASVLHAIEEMGKVVADNAAKTAEVPK